MDTAAVQALVEGIRTGTIAPDDAVARLSRLPFADLGDALVDHHRALRQGMPEAVYGPGKSAEQCVRIVAELLDHGTGPVLVTRVTDEQNKALVAAHGAAEQLGGCLLWRRPSPTPGAAHSGVAGAVGAVVAVVSAGTSDSVVADEVEISLAACALATRRICDVGVAGIHRLLAHLDPIVSADAVIVIAGMEGALASVVGGLTSKPVVAVPTSVGYGASLEGVTALLAMHASCASGVSVVGIDNGFGAAMAVARMLRR